MVRPHHSILSALPVTARWVAPTDTGPVWSSYADADRAARRQHALTQVPQYLAVRECPQAGARIEYRVGPLDEFDQAEEADWRLDQLYIERHAPEAFSVPRFAASEDQARLLAIGQADHWGVPFCWALRDDTYVAVALGEWPRYHYAGWRRLGVIRHDPI